MRRYLVAVFAVSALMLAACGDDAENPAGDPPVAAADAGAGSAAACTGAVVASKTGATTFETGLDDLLKLAMEGDEAKADAAEKEFRGKLTAWSDKLTELAGGQVEADVKTALTDAAGEGRAPY